MSHVLAGVGLERGFDARILSRVPLGSGLSSSASLEIAVGRALRDLYSLSLDDIALARAAQRAENEFVGAPVGIMDQMACLLADERAALFLDTRDLTSARSRPERRRPGRHPLGDITPPRGWRLCDPTPGMR
jgi:galactokinase